ncbi:MAG TPA: hypothetical protein VEI97_12705, partial [bacterium]|nr:hypothetical protein [bacterium]
MRAAPAARYANLWPGISLFVHSSPEGAFEYDLEVQPGADPRHIQLRYSGLSRVAVDPLTGNLLLTTALGELSEAAPLAWQTDATGRRHLIACQFHLTQDPATEVPGAPGHADPQRVSFSFPHGFDPALPLTIDPTLVCATHSGSRAPVFGHTATYDATGHLYAAGPCYDPGYPTTIGAFDLTQSNGRITGNYSNPDVAVSRYSPDGRFLLYATYLGGGQEDYPHSLIVNHQDELLILGSTYSQDFPTTAGAFDRQRAGFGATTDAFIAKLDSTGSRLLASTYLGGSDDDGLNPSDLRFFYGDDYRGDLAVDSLDRVFIASCTSSPDFPFTPGAIRPASGFGSTAVVARFSANLSTLEWAAGLGTSATAYGLYLPPSGAPYVVGTTAPAGLPTTPGTLDPQASVGNQDGFVAQLSPTGTTLLASTYLRPTVGPFSTE